MLLERTGICIQTSCSNATSFLTSASLGPRTAEGKMNDNVTVNSSTPFLNYFILNCAVSHTVYFLSHADQSTASRW
jgi:hypothetical protein